MRSATAAVADFAERARTRLRAEPPGLLDHRSDPKGDHALDAERRQAVGLAELRHAAVLVPVVMHDEEPSVILTERASNLRDHSGQISFPGGKVDETDGSPRETALREAEEEIGLDRRHVSPLGYLDAYLSSTNYFIIPMVAFVSPDHALRLNLHEVASAFEVPLGFLMDKANHELHSREWQGRMRRYYAMPFGDRYIWGATAGILRNMYERLYGS